MRSFGSVTRKSRNKSVTRYSNQPQEKYPVNQSRNQCPRWFFYCLLLSSFTFSSCATWYQRNLAFQTAVYNGELDKAEKLLEKEDTDLNVVVGLCVGHDTLFFRYSAAPVTTLIVKDRVLGHNSAAALYTSSSYYDKLFEE